MKAPKKPVTFRLSDTTRKELENLAKRYQVSQADVIAIVIHAHTVGWELDDIDDYFDAARLG